ncbi:restriction endonuclease subunit S [Ignatzschineria sp. RMDPL8A]|uniref:restriction endonuclease subunit S n=1 Tax=Ignatzschineria sp. RMDPL8A TaxID=2999236 RepID=UPI0024466DA2|nr:restriction endonuclease subunit S [Ignatzschineria sp. RMDPL8A]MDG9730335.1 restriction endonuclease subunit S [Ignatzschineria sp. RMDPL8A]
MQVPEGWEIKYLREIVKFSQGIQVDTTQQSTVHHEGYIRFLRIADFVSKTEPPRFIKKPNENFIVSDSDLSMIRYGSASAGDVVRGLSGAIANNLFRLIPNEQKIYKSYLYLYLGQKKIKHYLICGSSSSTMPAITFDLVGRTEIILPPLAEQEKIAEILSTWDHAIEQTERLKANAETHKQALMQQLLTGKKRFPEFEGEWEKKSLKLLVKISKGQQKNRINLTANGKYPVINGGIEPSGYTDEYNRMENIITISEGGNSCGYVNFIKTKFWCGGHCYSMLEPSIDNHFLFHALKFREKALMQLRVGSGLPNIQKRDVESFKIEYPVLMSEQQKIAAVLNTADREIELLAQKLDHLKTEKRALMQQLLTGKRRVKVDG